VRALLVLIVLVLVNLPAAHERWTDREVATKGHDVAATVLDARGSDGRYLVDYVLPEDEDPAQVKFSASVDAATFESAESNKLITVRVVPGKPGSNRPEGLVASSLFTVIAITGDAVLILIGVLTWYRRRNPGDMPDTRPRPVGL